MISITVHHHHQHSQAAISGSHKCATETTATSGQQLESSNVQVEYLARYFRSANTNQPQAQQHQQLHTRSRSHQINPISQVNKMDSNNNNSTPADKTKDFKHVSDSENDNQQKQQQSARAKTVAPKPVHSRSISLVINPEFCSDSESELALCRKRSLPRILRRTRLLLVDDNNASPAPEKTENTQQPPMDINNNNEEKRLVAETEEEKLLCSIVQDCNQHNIQMLHQTTQAVANPNIDQLVNLTTDCEESSKAVFRQAGLLLRTISDEFFR